MNSLLVGVGIGDRGAPGDEPVDAVTAEALGYDFVSAFDHPVADAATAQAIAHATPPRGRQLAIDIGAGHVLPVSGSRAE